jgi:hypothetical protein
MLYDKLEEDEERQAAEERRKLEEGMALLERVESEHELMDRSLLDHALKRASSLRSIDKE